MSSDYRELTPYREMAEVFYDRSDAQQALGKFLGRTHSSFKTARIKCLENTSATDSEEEHNFIIIVELDGGKDVVIVRYLTACTCEVVWIFEEENAE